MQMLLFAVGEGVRGRILASDNISLNQKHKKLFSEDGIRLGTQQIARYNWEEQDIDELAKLLFLIKHKGSLNEIKTIRKKLIDKKIPHFTYNEIIIE